MAASSALAGPVGSRRQLAALMSVHPAAAVTRASDYLWRVLVANGRRIRGGRLTLPRRRSNHRRGSRQGVGRVLVLGGRRGGRCGLLRLSVERTERTEGHAGYDRSQSHWTTPVERVGIRSCRPVSVRRCGSHGGYRLYGGSMVKLAPPMLQVELFFRTEPSPASVRMAY